MILYLIKSSVGMFLCWIIYKQILAKKKSFQFNRFFLMAGLIGSCVAPLITVPLYGVKDSTPPILEFISLESTNIPIALNIGAGETLNAHTFAPLDILFILYFVICGVMVIRLCLHVFKMLWSAHVSFRGDRSGMKIAVIKSNKTPFSFFNTLFIDAETFKKGIPEDILNHERCHVRQLHSIDRLIVEFIILMHWWNPVVYFVKKAIVENHEYLADHYVLNRHHNSKNYVSRILEYSVPNISDSLLSNSFAHSSINKRIKMIANNASFTSLKTRVLASCILLLAFVACTDLAETESTLGFSEDDLTTVFAEDVGVNVSYPAALYEKAEALGMNIPLGIMPEYRSPSQELFDKMRTTDKFQIRLDRIEIENKTLSNYKRKEIKGFRIKGKGIMPVEEEQFLADLFTHEGYIRGFERGLKFMQDMVDRQQTILTTIEDTEEIDKDGRIPLPTIKRPSPALFASLAAPHGFLIKIDGKQVSNKVLRDMSPDDFAYYSKINMEVSLMTNERFEKFKEEISQGRNNK